MNGIFEQEQQEKITRKRGVDGIEYFKRFWQLERPKVMIWSQKLIFLGIFFYS